MFSIPELASLTSILTDKVNGYTLCESKGRYYYKFVKKTYSGEWADLAQVAVVGILEWVKIQPNTEKLNLEEVGKVADKAIREELKTNKLREYRGDGDCEWVGEDGEPFRFNPEDTDNLTPERAKAIQSAIDSIAQLVGSDATLILRLKLVHGLPYKAIKKRFSTNRSGYKDLKSSYLDSRLGYAHTRKAYSEEQIEQIFTSSLQLLQDRYKDGQLPCILRCLNFIQAEAEIRAEVNEDIKAFRKGEV